jgi:hypothetical protein
MRNQLALELDAKAPRVRVRLLSDSEQRMEERFKEIGFTPWVSFKDQVPPVAGVWELRIPPAEEGAREYLDGFALLGAGLMDSPVEWRGLAAPYSEAPARRRATLL